MTSHPDRSWQWSLSLLSAPHLHWGGNIRELEAVLERARNRLRASDMTDPVIEARHLDVEGEHPVRGAPARPVAQLAGESPGNQIEGRWKQLAEQKKGLDVLEKGIIEDALATCEGIVARAARILGVPRTGLISRMATLEIDPEKFKHRRR